MNQDEQVKELKLIIEQQAKLIKSYELLVTTQSKPPKIVPNPNIVTWSEADFQSLNGR